MDFKELEYILVIAQEKTISKAAERLYVSQPALSRFLLKLEERLGTELFQRKNRQYFPTCAGNLYLDMARKILETKQEFDTDLKRLLESGGGTISFGITPGRGRTVLPKVIPSFHKAYPNYELNIFEEDVATIEKLLTDGTIDLAFFTMGRRNLPAHSPIRYIRISREEIVLCTARNTAYSLQAISRSDRKYPWLDLRSLENETFLLLKDNMRLGQFTDDLLAFYQMAPRTIRLSSIDTALALVAQNYGVAFASSFRIDDHESAKKIDIFSIGDEVTEWDFAAACRNDFELQKPARHLIDLMRELASDYASGTAPYDK